jgi:hypothetical protein
MALNVDKNGFVLEGRFAGKHIDTIMAYAESLEDSVGGEEQTPAGTPPKSPAEKLSEHAEGRVDATAQLTAERLRADDETLFRQKVGEEDFTKYGESIRKTVQGLHLQQQMMKGVHWMVYIQLKSADPEFERRILGAPEPPPVEETDEEKVAREEEEAATATAAQEKKDESERLLRDSKPTPKATPPTVRPTSTARKAAPTERKSKLVANEKIVRAAREWGMTVDAYLLKLEDSGVTQEGLELQSRPKEESRRRSVFDRATAS